MNVSNIQKVEHNRFARADLEYRLLMVDDDMKLEALKDTNYIKTIVTLEDKMDLERKSKQSVQGNLYVRFLCFGNGSLSALHDRSYGFYRRQIILTVKDVPLDRVDDPYLIEKLQREADDIFLWCLEGLKRLLKINIALPSANVQRKIYTKLWNPGITLSLLCSHPGISGWKKIQQRLLRIFIRHTAAGVKIIRKSL